MRPERSRTTRAQRRGQCSIMGHQHQRGAALGVAGEQQIDDLLSCVLIQIAGRLVCDQICGFGASARATATRCCSPPDNSAG